MIEFKLNEIEVQRAEEFTREHDPHRRQSTTTFTFSPGPIGTKIEVSCVCGTRKDISDYEAW